MLPMRWAKSASWLSDPQKSCWNSEGAKQWNKLKLWQFSQAWIYLLGFPVSCKAIVDWLALLKCHFLVILFVAGILFPRLVACTSCLTFVSFSSGSSCGMEIMKPSLQGYCESETKASWEIHPKGSLNASFSSCSDGIVQLSLGHMVLCMSTHMYLWVKWPNILNMWPSGKLLRVMVA